MLDFCIPYLPAALAIHTLAMKLLSGKMKYVQVAFYLVACAILYHYVGMV